jgi:hypothetical protein
MQAAATTQSHPPLPRITILRILPWLHVYAGEVDRMRYQYIEKPWELTVGVRQG